MLSIVGSPCHLLGVKGGERPLRCPYNAWVVIHDAFSHFRRLSGVGHRLLSMPACTFMVLSGTRSSAVLPLANGSSFRAMGRLTGRWLHWMPSASLRTVDRAMAALVVIVSDRRLIG